MSDNTFKVSPIGYVRVGDGGFCDSEDAESEVYLPIEP
jgi:hypothetical protein